MKTCRVTIADTGHILLDRAEVALGAWARLKGLMGRKRLPPSEGMLLPRCNSVHTVFMRFPIDVIYLSKDDRVLKIVEKMPACHVSACWGAKSVLEMPANWAAKTGLRVGHVLEFGDTAAIPTEDPSTLTHNEPA